MAPSQPIRVVAVIVLLLTAAVTLFFTFDIDFGGLVIPFSVGMTKVVTSVKSTTDIPRALAYALGTVFCGLAGLGILLAGRPGVFAGALWATPLLALAITSSTFAALLATTLFFLVATALGELGLQWVHVGASSVVERTMLALGLGLGALTLIGLGVGSIGGLRPALALPGALLLGFVFGPSLVRTARRSDRPLLSGQARLPVVLLPAVAALVIAIESIIPYVVAPELNYDAASSHLVLAREFATRGSVDALPWSLGSYFPLLAQITYAFGTMFSSLDAAKYVHFFVGLFTVAAIATATYRWSGLAAALIAGALWLSIPLVVWEMSTAYIDLFGTLFAALACLTALKWLEGKQQVFAWLTGAMVGFSLGVKLNLGLIGAALFIAIVIAGVRTIKDLRTWTMAGFIATIVGIPWYLRTFLFTGNPVFPFMNGIFRSSQWEPVNENFNFGGFGMGTSASDWLHLPWRLTILTSHFGEVPDGALGVFPLTAMATLIVAPIMFRRDNRLWFLWVFTVLGTLLCFGYVQYIRYLLPIMPAAIILAGATLTAAVTWAFGRKTGIALAGLGVLASAAIAIPLAEPLQWKVPGGIPWEVDFGLESRTSYLERALRYMPTFEWMATNIQEGPSSNVLAVGYSDAPFAYGDAPIYIAHLTHAGRQILSSGSTSELVQRLRENQIKYVLFDLFPKPTPWKAAYLLSSDQFMSEHLELVHASAYVYLYRVVDTPPSTAEGPQVLKESDLSRLQPSGTTWQTYGSPPSDAGASACAGVRVGGIFGYLQEFPAVPNAVYTIVQRMASVSDAPTYGKVQVNWTLANGRSTTEIEIQPVTKQVSDFSMSSSSPPEAVRGTITVSGYGDAPVCVGSVEVFAPRL